MDQDRLPICWDLKKMDLIVKTPRMKREHLILNKDIIVDRSTGHGEDADYYERKPYGGRKWIDMRYARAVESPTKGHREVNHGTAI